MLFWLAGNIIFQLRDLRLQIIHLRVQLLDIALGVTFQTLKAFDRLLGLLFLLFQGAFLILGAAYILFRRCRHRGQHWGRRQRPPSQGTEPHVFLIPVFSCSHPFYRKFPLPPHSPTAAANVSYTFKCLRIVKKLPTKPIPTPSAIATATMLGKMV